MDAPLTREVGGLDAVLAADGGEAALLRGGALQVMAAGNAAPQLFGLLLHQSLHLSGPRIRWRLAQKVGGVLDTKCNRTCYRNLQEI